MKDKLFAAITMFSIIAQSAAAVYAVDGEVSDRSEAVDVYVNTFEQKQTIKGVGGAFTWYSDWLNNTKYKDEVYQILFNDAGLDVIRLKNKYGYSDDGTFSAVNDKNTIESAEKAAGKDIPVLMSSWSPPAYLKSNNTINGNGGTLKKDEDGKYMYSELGKYYADAVAAYRAGGVDIDYLSIQNEPDFNADYDGCVFAAQENEQFAQYSKALDATYEALKSLENPPLLMGPDSMTANDAFIASMINPSVEHGDGRVAAIGHHLYAGGSAENPDGYIRSMNILRDNFPDIPKWQTEYYRGNFIQTAWLITNTFVEEDAEAYIYWDTVWAADGGLVGIEYPWDSNNWKHEKGYIL